MIEGRIIVCIASAWDYDPTSKHHLMRILSARNEIIWVTYRGTRRPSANLADLKSAGRVLLNFARGMQPVAPSIRQITPFVIPGTSARAGRWINEAMLTAQIRAAIAKVDPDRKRPVQVWSFAPDVPYLVGRFDEECFVYYCVDDFAEFEGVDAKSLRAAEGELLNEADVIITTSDELQQRHSARRSDAVLVYHGVDYDHFAKAWQSPPPIPGDLQKIAQPIFGFFGLIGHWVDVELMAEVARQRPRFSFVLLGDHRVRVDALRALPNVHLLGRRPYGELPAYCAGFQAALMPFRLTRLTKAVNPIKLHEYLAAGLPVIGTSIPEAKRYPHLVSIADTPEQFALACDRVMPLSGAERATISQSVRNQTWKARVEILSEIVMHRVNGQPVSQPFNALASARSPARPSRRPSARPEVSRRQFPSHGGAAPRG